MSSEEAKEITAVLSDDAKLDEVVDHVFNDADADGNGNIDSTELAEHMKVVYDDIGLGEVDADLVKSTFDSFDTDKNGVLDKSEFRKYVISMLEKDRECRK